VPALVNHYLAVDDDMAYPGRMHPRIRTRRKGLHLPGVEHNEIGLHAVS